MCLGKLLPIVGGPMGYVLVIRDKISCSTIVFGWGEGSQKPGKSCGMPLFGPYGATIIVLSSIISCWTLMV